MNVQSFLRSNMSHLTMAASLAGLFVTVTGLRADDDAAKPPLVTESFEQGTKSPEGWKQGAAIPGVKYVWDRKQASDGERSLGFKKTANRYFPIAAWSRSLKHTGDQPAVTITAQVKASRAAKAVMDVLFLNENGEWIKHEWAAYIGQKDRQDPLAHHDWKPYSGTVAIPPGTSQIVVGLQMYGPGEVWFDELEVTYAEAAPTASK